MKWLPPSSDTLCIVLTPEHGQELTRMYIKTLRFTIYIVRGKWTVVLQLISFHFVHFKWIYLSIWWPNMQHIYYRWPPRWNLKLKSHWFWNNLICYRDPVPQLVKLAKLHRSHSPWLPAPESYPPAPLLQSGNSTKGWSAPNLERRIRETSKYRSKTWFQILLSRLMSGSYTDLSVRSSWSQHFIQWVAEAGEISLYQTNTNFGKVPTRF